MESEAAEVVCAWDVLERNGGEGVAIVDRQGVEEGAVIDEGDDVGIGGVGGGHEDADVRAGFGDFGSEVFLWFAVSEDGNAEACAGYFGDRGCCAVGC